MEKCANCEREIGNLEVAHLHNNAVICELCYNKLNARAPSTPPRPAPAAQAYPPQTSQAQYYNPGYASPAPAADVMSSIVPYKNVPALLAYYIGLFSFIPCIGAPMGIAALILGLKGLKIANANPNAKGKGHAIFGIVMGAIFGAFYCIVDAFVLVAMFMSAGHAR